MFSPLLNRVSRILSPVGNENEIETAIIPSNISGITSCPSRTFQLVDVINEGVSLRERLCEIANTHVCVLCGICTL